MVRGGDADVELIGPGFYGEYRLRYTPRTDQAVGKIDTRINVRILMVDGTNGPDIVIPVRGVVVPPVRLSPGQVAISKPSHAEPHLGDSGTAGVSVVHVVSLDSSEWKVLEILECPEWLKVDLSQRSVIKFGVSSEVALAKPLIVHALVESSANKRCKLPLTINLM